MNRCHCGCYPPARGSLCAQIVHCVAALLTIIGPLITGTTIVWAETEVAREPTRNERLPCPRVWMTYQPFVSPAKDFKDLQTHGVGLVSVSGGWARDRSAALEIARRSGMKYHIHLPDITSNRQLVSAAGLEPVAALMIGGVYQGRAIDRHLFSFTAGQHEIVIEPPVYNKGLAYSRHSGGTGLPKKTERIAHYFPDIGAPARAEIIVPLARYDGQQHLEIRSAAITEAPPDTVPPADSAAGLPDVSEIRNRKLYRLRFDLTGLDQALLDQVGVAVYWPYGGSDQYWMFGRGNVSAWARSTRQALRRAVRRELNGWLKANAGTFPSDVVVAARYGDECFYTTGHLSTPPVSYPLWEYSEASVQAFRQRAGDVEYPRTWGFPEIYGSAAYAWWLYTLHEGCAHLCGCVRAEVARTAPGLLVFRNTTRMGVFSLANDHDGSGQELLTQNLDVVHLDPYPVNRRGYAQNIPRDMSYCGGLARRYGRLLVPWMQAHVYGELRDPTAEQIERMAAEQYAQGVDAVMWLGYSRGNTFPQKAPASWQAAGDFHRRLANDPPPKPRSQLAVLRSYRAWALSSDWEAQIRNPADWLLQQLLEVWSVKYRQPYDVFELPPQPTAAQRAAVAQGLQRYEKIVATEPYGQAWVIGAGTQGQTIDPTTAAAQQAHFERQLRLRGWLPADGN